MNLMINIRNFKHADIDGCVSLIQNAHFSSFSRKRFEWLHLKSPLAPSHITVAETGGEIIGFYAAIKKHITMDDQLYVGARDIDPVVHPSFRKKGLFVAMLQHGVAEQHDVDFHFNFANAASRPGFLREGWHVAGQIPDIQIRVDFKKFYSKSFIAWLMSKCKNHGGSVTDQKAVLLEQPDFTDFTVAGRNKITVRRSPEYLQWRYLENPDRQYLFIGDAAKTQLTNILIGYPCPQMETLYVNDFLHHKSVSNPSLQYAVNYIKESGYQSLRTWVTCPIAIRQKMILNPFGKKHGINLLVRKAAGKRVPADIFQLEKWILTPGDLEIL